MGGEAGVGGCALRAQHTAHSSVGGGGDIDAQDSKTPGQVALAVQTASTAPPR